MKGLSLIKINSNVLKTSMKFNLFNRHFCDIKKSEDKHINMIFSIHKDKYSVHSDKKYEIKQVARKNRIMNIVKPHYILSEEEKKLKDSFFGKLKKRFASVFLPKDFPYSVRSDYLKFSKYSFISNTTYFYLNFIFLQITIESLGVSCKTSAITSAGLNWALKEGLGQIASFVAVAKFGALAEKNSKEQRIFSSLLFHSVFVLELSILLYPNFFVILAALSTLIKITAINISIISRTGIFLQMAKKHNLIDISLKFQNQSNIAVFIGTFFGYLTSLYFKLNFQNSLVILAICNIFNFFICRLAYNELVMHDFNYQRLYIFAKKFMSENRLLSPKEVTRFEKLTFMKPTIKFTTHSAEFLMKQDKQMLTKILKEFDHCNFIIFPKKKFNLLSLNRKYHLYTFLKLNANNLDVLRAFFMTVRLEEILNFTSKYTEEEVILYIREALSYIHKIITDDMFKQMDSLEWKYNLSNLEKNWSRYQTVNIKNE